MILDWDLEFKIWILDLNLGLKISILDGDLVLDLELLFWVCDFSFGFGNQRFDF